MSSSNYNVRQEISITTAKTFLTFVLETPARVENLYCTLRWLHYPSITLFSLLPLNLVFGGSLAL